MKRYICIHGHFYQPPRENAWLEEVELQESAHPFHDWNERINSECYHPNTASRILNESGSIIDISNNYSRISFNFGPTLLSWMEAKDPETYHGILEADRISQKRFGGHGSAMAQVYNHMIMPLANLQDKETQVIWGLKDFEYRFKREPEGMWLAEAAVDTESLEVLAANGIKFTVLAPTQAQSYKLYGHENWLVNNGNPINTRIPYLYKLPSGKEIVLYFYDGDISQNVAFNGLLNSGRTFADSLLGAFDPRYEHCQLVHMATDGESYGHHHKHGDMALAYCLDYIENGKKANLTNYGEFTEICLERGEVKIHENSSWSCVHGVERWRNDCGCNSGGRPEWSQEWRKPLREALDWLRDTVNDAVNENALKVLIDPWDARNRYIEVINDRESSNIHKYLNENPEAQGVITKGTRWLEMQRHAMLMYTSCGWFFDEVSGIETTQVLQYACRTIQLYEQLTGKRIEDKFIKLLEVAPSNLDKFRSAADVYREYVVPTRLDLERVGMHFAISTLFEKEPDSLNIFNYTARSEKFYFMEAGVQRYASGIFSIRSDVTFSEKRFAFAVLYMGQHNIIGNISLDMVVEDVDRIHEILSKDFEESRLGDMIINMQEHFGTHRFTLWHLFKDQKLKVIHQILDKSLLQVDNSMRKIYNRDYPLINMMKTSDIPIPEAYISTLEHVLNEDLRNCFKNGHIDLADLERVANEFEKWNLKIVDVPATEMVASRRIVRAMKKVNKNPHDLSRLKRINGFFMFLKKFALNPEVSKAQNLYFYTAKSVVKQAPDLGKEWAEEFSILGSNLRVKLEI